VIIVKIMKPTFVNKLLKKAFLSIDFANTSGGLSHDRLNTFLLDVDVIAQLV